MHERWRRHGVESPDRRGLFVVQGGFHDESVYNDKFSKFTFPYLFHFISHLPVDDESSST